MSTADEVPLFSTAGAGSKEERSLLGNEKEHLNSISDQVVFCSGKSQRKKTTITSFNQRIKIETVSRGGL